jgi:mannose-6-phosphate isomerase-like protein (cupin superfamily)
MAWRRIVNVPAVYDVVTKDPTLSHNQFLSDPGDRIRLELQNRHPGDGTGPNNHLHTCADTVHIVVEGEGEYIVAPGVWVPAKAGDIFLSRGKELHGGRGTNPDKPLRYLVIEGPAPGDVVYPDGGQPNFGTDEERAQVSATGEIKIRGNGGIIGTNVLMAGPSERPAWVERLAPGDYYKKD